MSCEEIRWWMRELRRRGWNRGVMQRLLGSRHHNWCKADGKDWIYPTEQIRFSRQLRRVIAGEIVLKVYPRPSAYQRKQDAVLAAHPVPLVAPLKKVYSLKLGRLVDVPAYTPPENPLPDFRTALTNLRRWDP